MAISEPRPPGLPIRDPKPPETEDQYETLLDQVWRCEREADFYRRIDNAVRIEEERQKRALRRKAE